MMASLEGCSDPKYVERNAAMPAIMATVEWAGRSGLLVRMPRMRMPSAPIWLSTVSARLMSAMPVSASSSSLSVWARHECQEQALVFDEDVVELADEAPRQLLFVGLLGDDSIPRAPEVVDEFGERQDEGFAEQALLSSRSYGTADAR